MNSQSDTFHEKLSDEAIESIFGAMALAPQHTFQVLTKRSERMLEWFTTRGGLETREECVMRAAERLGEKLYGKPGFPFVFDSRGDKPENYMNASKASVRNRRKWFGWPLPNVHIGVSVENADYLYRVGDLVRVPAAARFISAEPLLGPLELKWEWLADLPVSMSLGLASNKIHRERGISQIIVGGESGTDARPMDPKWAREIRDQCRKHGVAFFMKQVGTASPLSHTKKGDDPLEWPEDLRIQEVPT